jgi:hypothetical protein
MLILIGALNHFVIDEGFGAMKFLLAVLEISRGAFEQFDFFAQFVRGEAAGNFEGFGLVEFDKIAETKGLGYFLRIIGNAARRQRRHCRERENKAS